MDTVKRRSWVQHCFLASVAAASLGVTSAHAQSYVQDPEGMPSTPQARSSSYQNPFSTAYQKLRNRIKGQSNANEAEYIDANGNVHKPASKKHNWTANAEPVATGHSTEFLMPKKTSASTAAKKAAPTPTRHTTAKPTQQQLRMRRTNQTQLNPQAALPTEGADRVIHVRSVNEGTPTIGSESEVQPDAELLRSLGPGEEIKSVKERVIGVYRDGKLVPITSTTGTAVPTAMPPARYVPTAKKEIDPWFGDAVNAPSAEVESLDSKEEVH